MMTNMKRASAMTDLNTSDIDELNDAELNQVVGGYDVGDTVRCSATEIAYCSNCGRLLKNYEATITGVLDGKTIYWVTRNCCGRKTSIIETDILD